MSDLCTTHRHTVRNNSSSINMKKKTVYPPPLSGSKMENYTHNTLIYLYYNINFNKSREKHLAARRLVGGAQNFHIDYFFFWMPAISMLEIMIMMMMREAGRHITKQKTKKKDSTIIDRQP